MPTSPAAPPDPASPARAEPAGPAQPGDETDVGAMVGRRLESFLARMREEATALGPDALTFTEAAAGTLQGGKRLRARFAHAGWTAVAAGSPPPTALGDLCAALEVFQSAALVHDDLIDNSDIRRGRPAAHRALEATHDRSGWAGDGESFGRSAAILLGDLLVAWSDDLLEQALAGHPQAAPVRSEYGRMRREVTVGQFLDIAEESAWVTRSDDAQADRALRIASLKSARYSIEQPLALGALLGGASAEQEGALRGFGHPLGLAFQLRDDVLGVFGDAAVTGKPAGDDLREGKRTVLIALAREGLDAAGRRDLDAQVGDPALTETQVDALRKTIRDTGALDRVETMIAAYGAEAETALASAPLHADAVAELRDLARRATQRSA